MEEVNKEPWEIFPLPPDLEITVGNLTIKGHKPMLGFKSPVFKSMFETNMVEGNSNKLTIVDIDEETFLIFLRYLYLPENHIRSEDLSMELLNAANKYMVRSLLKVFENSLAFVSVDNAIECATIACQSDLLNWRSKLVDFVAYHFNKIKNCKNFKILQSDVPFMIDVFNVMNLDPETGIH